MTATGKPKKSQSGGAPVRNCVCGCGVDARLFSFVLTKKRVVRGGLDLLTPLTQAIDAQRRRKLLEQIAQGKCEARVACCHVHPDDMYWTKKCRLRLKPRTSPRVSLKPLAKTPDVAGAPLRATRHCLNTFGASEAVSPQRADFAGDSARRAMSSCDGAEAVEHSVEKVDRSSRTPPTRETSQRRRQRRRIYTPSSVAIHQVLDKESIARTIDFEEEPTCNREACVELMSNLSLELDEARHALKLVRRQADAKRLETNLLRQKLACTRLKLADARAMHDGRISGYLTFQRLMTDEKLRKGCNTLTGWKTPELFKSFWEWVNGGKKRWSDRCVLFHESKGPSPQRAARSDLRVIGMDDAFFMLWLIAKQGISRSAAGYLFGIDPACVTRYFISITSMLQEFIEREFPSMSDEEIYLTQDAKWAAQMGQPVHSIIDCTEVSAQGCSSGTSHAAMYSSYKGRNTVKFLTGIAANGMIDYISPGVSGSTSDRTMCIEHGHLEWMKGVRSHVRTRDNKPVIKVVLADKGFTNVVEDYLEHDVWLMTPTRKFNNMQFTDADVKASRENSNLRVHVERANAVAKRFKYLTKPVEIIRSDLFAREFRVIYTIAVNLGVSLCHDSLDSCRMKCVEF